MPHGLEDVVSDAALDHMLKTATWTAPTNIYVALFDGEPGNGGSELAGSGYARVQHETWHAAEDGEATNDGVVEFPEATGDWSEADWFALFDAATDGTRLARGPLYSPKTVESGDAAKFGDATLTIAIERTP